MKIEIDKPVIPQFVADWIESFYEEGGSKYDAMGSIFVYSSKYDKAVHDWYVNNKDDFITAVMYGYEVEQEPLYYAKIKGWEISEGNIHWDAIVKEKVVFPQDKSHVGLRRTKLTKAEWNELGINNVNADFERVE